MHPTATLFAQLLLRHAEQVVTYRRVVDAAGDDDLAFVDELEYVSPDPLFADRSRALAEPPDHHQIDRCVHDLGDHELAVVGLRQAGAVERHHRGVRNADRHRAFAGVVDRQRRFFSHVFLQTRLNRYSIYTTFLPNKKSAT